MKIKQIITVGIAGMAMGTMALDNVEVTEVKARQRYPWNGIVDIDFKLDSTPTEPYCMNVEVYDNVGKTNLAVRSAWTEGVSQKDNPCMVRTDTRRIVWDAAADLPNGFKCTNVLVTCRDDRTLASSNRYMIVDLAGGPSASRFPISYTNCPPVGGWTEEHKLTKLVLRRIEPSVFYMGAPASDPEKQTNESYHQVTVSKPYYISVFELTENQAALISGTGGADTQPALRTWNEIRGDDVVDTVTASLPVNSVDFTINQSAGATAYSWPQTSGVADNSLVGKLRAKAMLSFDLPTEAQWELACRAQSVMPLNIGTTNSAENASLVNGPAKYDPTGTHFIYVGNYMPNAYGLYDMTGNASEWCLDIYRSDLGIEDVEDPKGAALSFESASLLSKSCYMRTIYNYNGTWGEDPMYPAGYFKYKNEKYSPMKGSTYDNRWTIYLKFTGYGIRHSIRGASVRSAARTSALAIPPSIFTSGVYINYGRTSSVSTDPIQTETVYPAFDQPKHGVRLVVVIDA